MNVFGAGSVATITVCDDGPGLAADFNAADSTSIGLRISQVMARQIGAEYRLTNSCEQAGCAPSSPSGACMTLVLTASQLTGNASKEL